MKKNLTKGAPPSPWQGLLAPPVQTISDLSNFPLYILPQCWSGMMLSFAYKRSKYCIHLILYSSYSFWYQNFSGLIIDSIIDSIIKT